MYKPGMTQQKSQYSIMDNQQFQNIFDQDSDSYIGGGNKKSNISGYEKIDNTPFMSADVARASVSGAQAGGVSGGLISGGLTASLAEGGLAGAGPYAVAGGFILSQLEAAQKAEADAEKQRIKNEMDRRDNMQKTYASMANQTFGI